MVVGQQRSRPDIGGELVLGHAYSAALQVGWRLDRILAHVDRGVTEGARYESRDPTYGQSPIAVLTAKLESDSSQMSNSACRNARKKISSGLNVMIDGVHAIDLSAAVQQGSGAVVVPDCNG